MILKMFMTIKSHLLNWEIILIQFWIIYYVQMAIDNTMTSLARKCLIAILNVWIAM